MRNVLESAEREFGSQALESVTVRIAPRLRPHLSLERLRASAALDTLPLDEAEEVLLTLDLVLGDGSGRALERIAEDLYAKALIQGGGAVRLKDLFGTMARLRGLIEHPFEDVTILFELTKTDNGLSLGLSVTGQPRATKLLRHLAAGAIRAAERFARESVEDSLKLYGEIVADRARLVAQYRSVSEPVRDRFDGPEAPTPSRRLSGASRLSSTTSLSAEVDRILNPSLAVQAERRRGSVPPPAPSRRSNPRMTSPSGEQSGVRIPIASTARTTSPSSSGEIETVSSPDADKIPPGESNQA
ncbi:MAG TPA: hypothetical protein VM686_21165 [Polyangiaceae bacterium]|nr:hypothetical protein [Polyangiaceae bacterium]